MKRMNMAVLAVMLPAASFAAEGGKVIEGGSLFFACVVLAAGLGLGLAAAVCGLGQGLLAGRAMEAMARQPEMASKIQTAMLLGLAFVESLVIYSLLISFILLFANPFSKYFGG